MTRGLDHRVAAAVGTEIVGMRPIGGGSICSAYRAELADGRAAFVKTVARPQPGFFAAEAVGLALLAGAVPGGGAPVPAVLAVADDLLALEWVEPAAPDAASAEDFGRALAATHRHGAPAFGRTDGTGPAPGYIGSLPLDNTAAATWPEFYAERRVRPYLRGAVDRRSIRHGDAADVERVLARIGELAGPPEPPALLHGDLWSGNVLWAADDGAPRAADGGAHEARAYLVDPAVHGGHRETDLAMLALFGTPHLGRVLAAYDESAPVAAGWRDRVPLHQLHPVLVHAVLFDGSYGAQAGALAREALRS